MCRQRTTTRAEQMRAAGLTDRAIARELKVPVAAVCRWFGMQDRLARTEDLERAASGRGGRAGEPVVPHRHVRNPRPLACTRRRIGVPPSLSTALRVAPQAASDLCQDARS